MGCGSSNMASRTTTGTLHTRRTSSASSSSSGRSTHEDHNYEFQTTADYGNPGGVGYQNYTVHQEYNAETGNENDIGNEDHFSESGVDDD